MAIPFMRVMTGEMDLSGEVDATDVMVEQQEQARDRAERDENEREAGHDGSVETEDFSVEEALESL